MEEKYRLKVGAYLEFDRFKEEDMISSIEEMVSRREMSKFTSNCVRFVLEHPDLMREYNISGDSNKLAKQRKDFFSKMTARLDSLDASVKMLENEVQDCMDLLSAHKMIGTSDKVENVACAELLIKRHIRKLNSQLKDMGLDIIMDRKLVDKDLDAMKKKSEDLMAYCIENYDGVIAELRNMLSLQGVQVVQGVQDLRDVRDVVISREEPIVVEETGESVKEEPVKEEPVKKEKHVERLSESADASAEVSDEDLDFMSAFLGR